MGNKKPLGYLIFIFCLLYFLFLMFRGTVKSSFLRNNSINAKAIIIDKKNSFPNDNFGEHFSYSYRFFINGVLYEGDSQSDSFKVGDSILIEYSPTYPNFNRPITKDK